jgi:type I restriction enzyme M protein
MLLYACVVMCISIYKFIIESSLVKMNISETETTIKRVLPYLMRRGYEDEDFTFEAPTDSGFIDLLIKHKSKPAFLIEVKRDSIKLRKNHIEQALRYGTSLKVPFVVVTNGSDFQMYNTTTKCKMSYCGSERKIPQKTELAKVLKIFKDKSTIDCISGENISGLTNTLQFAPGVTLNQVNKLIQECHNIVRDIEKNEESVFSDFSKILFLRLLEEKKDEEGKLSDLPYTYSFDGLAKANEKEADQVLNAIKKMLELVIEKMQYNDVITSNLGINNPKTCLRLVKKISSISWIDCDYDTKGAAFEYFVRATLKGKKLGQYFTPRPIVNLMLHLSNYQKIITSLKYGKPFYVLDTSCGTGGFLVHAMNKCIVEVKTDRSLTDGIKNEIITKLKKNTFYGIDANPSVASSAKMNMIIAGDGHTNISCNDTLVTENLIKLDNGTTELADMVLTNPPFGTSEVQSIGSALSNYDVKTTKGQALFLQKMIMSTRLGGTISSVIDEGLLNNSGFKEVREHLLQNCRIQWIISLPDVTFKPNKINVRSSIIIMKKIDPDIDMNKVYDIKFIKLNDVGYDSRGELDPSYNTENIANEILNEDIDKKLKSTQYYDAFSVSSSDIVLDPFVRLDFRYWNPFVIDKINNLRLNGCYSILEINTLETKRGKSPSANQYVDRDDGYALVIKSGSNVSAYGTIVGIDVGDFVDEITYESITSSQTIKLVKGDILLSSTGDGTLGKCCVYDLETPAIADTHVTIIRLDQTKFNPYFICDYLRSGFGQLQIQRRYTGSTGMIELTPDAVNEILIPKIPIKEQIKYSADLRQSENEYISMLNQLTDKIGNSRERFYLNTI